MRITLQLERLPVPLGVGRDEGAVVRVLWEFLNSDKILNIEEHEYERPRFTGGVKSEQVGKT